MSHKCGHHAGCKLQELGRQGWAATQHTDQHPLFTVVLERVTPNSKVRSIQLAGTAVPCSVRINCSRAVRVLAEEFGESVGLQSRCLEHSQSVRRSVDGASYASASRPGTGCYTVACKPDGTLSILVDGAHRVPFHHVAWHNNCCIKSRKISCSTSVRDKLV